MKNGAITIRIEEETWRGFKHLSRRRGKTASQMLRALMEETIRESGEEAGRDALLAMGRDSEEGRGPGDLSRRADEYLYGSRRRGGRRGMSSRPPRLRAPK